MHCFNHNDVEAVGICRACNKGLCKGCAVDLGFGLSCKGDHEEIVSYINKANTEGRHLVANRNIYVAPAFFIILGTIYAGFSYSEDANIMNIGTTIGAVFITFGIYILMRSRKLVKARSPE